MIELKIRGKFPFPEYRPGMSSKEYVSSAFYEFPLWDSKFLCQEKLDGWFGIIHRKDSECRWHRDWSKYTILKEAAENFILPKDTIIVGEVGYGTEKETRLLKKTNRLRFVPYDILKYKGEELFKKTHEERFSSLMSILPDLIEKNEFVSVQELSWINLCSRDGLENKVMAWNFFKDVLSDGGEGIVLKEYSGTLKSNSPCTSMYKVKKFLTKDYVCLGFSKSSSELYLSEDMSVSSMECGLYVDGRLKEVTKTSGFDFQWRKKFSENSKEYIGKVVELGGFEIFPSGAMRHSSFLRFREDVDPENCVL